MPTLFGKKMTRRAVLQRVGDMSQIAGAKVHELADGPARGVRAVDVYTGSGFRFTVLPDRGLDIAAADHNGRSLCWHSGTMETHPAFYQPEGIEWLYGFYGGLMVTCGLSHCGAPCIDQGEPLGLHGRVSNTPAREVGVRTGWEGNDYYVTINGTVCEARVFGTHLRLDRTITAWAGEDRLFVHDVVTNTGHDPGPHMMLYHCNFGYPVVDERSSLIAPSRTVTPRDDLAEDGKRDYATFHGPRRGWVEKVYYHDLFSRRGETTAGIVNKPMGFGAYLRFRRDQLPLMVEWKQMGQGEYVVGLEPATNRVEGRDICRALKTLRLLKPGESRVYDLEIGALPSGQACSDFTRSVHKLSAGRKPKFGRNVQI